MHWYSSCTPLPHATSLPQGDTFAKTLRCNANLLQAGSMPTPCSPLRRFVKWIEDGTSEDPFLNPELMKNNPWVEKGKCTIL